MLLRAKAARRGGVAQHKPADSMNIGKRSQDITVGLA